MPSQDLKGALEIIPGSQNKVFSDQEIRTITLHSIPTVCELIMGGALFLHPQTLQRTVIQNDVREKRLLRVYFAE